MRFKNLDLIIVMMIVAINIGLMLLPATNALVGIIFALPLILLLPGYALTQVLFRRRVQEEQTALSIDELNSPAYLKPGHPIGKADQLVMSLGLSLAMDVLVGFGLNILPVGLYTLSWIISLGSLTGVFVLLAALLRQKDLPQQTGPSRLRLSGQGFVLCVLAILVAVSAIWLSLIRPLQPQSSFTQFWMLPANQAGKVCEISLGAQSFETSAETFRIELTTNGASTATWSAIVLIPQQKWIQSIIIKSGMTSNLQLKAQLYKASTPDTVYREVHLTFTVSSFTTNGMTKQQCVLDA